MSRDGNSRVSGLFGTITEVTTLFCHLIISTVMWNQYWQSQIEVAGFLERIDT